MSMRNRSLQTSEDANDLGYRLVTGYLTHDGEFYPTQAEAELRVSIKELAEAAVQLGIDPSKFTKAIQDCAPQVTRFLAAQRAIQEQDDGVEAV